MQIKINCILKINVYCRKVKAYYILHLNEKILVYFVYKNTNGIPRCPLHYYNLKENHGTDLTSLIAIYITSAPCVLSQYTFTYLRGGFSGYGNARGITIALPILTIIFSVLCSTTYLVDILKEVLM